MGKRQSIAEGRRSLPSLVREAEAGRAVELTRRGDLVAVLIGRRQYERLASSPRGFGDAYEEFRREVGLGELALDPDEIFGGVRPDTRGRDVGP